MKFRKRTLAALLAVMLFCALPMGVLAVSHADHNIGWQENLSGPTTVGDGSHYLTDNLTAGELTQGSTAPVTICLNGFTLTCDKLTISDDFSLENCRDGGEFACGEVIVPDNAGFYIYDGISVDKITVKNTGYIEGKDDKVKIGSVTADSGTTYLAGSLSVGSIKVEDGASLSFDSSLQLQDDVTIDMPLTMAIENNSNDSTLLGHLKPAQAGYGFYKDGNTIKLGALVTLNVQSDPTAGGTAAIDGQTGTSVSLFANDKAKLIATPSDGYVFDGWYNLDASSTRLSAETTYEYTCTANATLTAKFTPVLAVENILTNTDESTVQFTATYGGVATTITGVTALSSGAPSCSDDGTVDLTDVVPHDYEYEITCAEGAKAKAKLFVNGVTNVTSLTNEFDLGSVTPNAQVAFGFPPAFTYSADGSTWVDAVDAPGTWTVKVAVTENAAGNVPALEYTYEITVKLPKPTVSADPETVKLTAGAGSSTLTAESTVSGVTYQWKKDGAEISGATSATLTENYSDADAGKSFQYTCVITLNGASTESDSVTVTVKLVNTIGDVQISDLTYGETPAPSLTEQPTYGSAEYVYATSETGPYSATVPENAGTYYVKATVPAGTDYDAVETDPVSFTINKAPNTNLPSVIVTGERVKGLKDGTIQDVTSAMEYKSESESGWHDCPDGILPNLAPGKYQVRYKETDNYLAGNPTKVTVKEGGGIPSDASFRFVYTPLNTLDPALNSFFSTLADLQTDMLAKVKSQKMSNKAPTGTAYWDIVLEYCLKGDTVWHTVTGDLFPAQGFLITIPYEKIATGVTASNTRFYAAHVFTYGDKTGTYEYPDVTNAAGGASLKVIGTSPLLLAYITEGGGNSGGNSGGIGSAVPTGDTNNPVLWGSLLGLSVLGCGAMVVVPKLKKKKEEKNT